VKQNAYRPHPDARKIGQGNAQRLSFQIAPSTARRKQPDNLLQEPK